MIFYYSATGNSKWLANRIADALGDEAVDILESAPKAYTFTKDDYCGFVFPIHWCQAPDFVKDFAKDVDAGDAWTFAAVTHSCQTGKAIQQFSKECCALKAGYGLIAPDNSSCIGLDYDTEETTLEKLSTIEARADVIIEHLKAKDERIESFEGEDPEEKTRTGLGGLKEMYSTTKYFSVDKTLCKGCKLCAMKCPAKAIRMEDDIPVWFQEDCYLCVSCINNCPTEAIQFQDKSKGVYRYNFNKYMKILRTLP